MDVIEIMQRISQEHNVAWTDQTMLGLMADYIERQGSPEAFEDFILTMAEADVEMGNAGIEDDLVFVRVQGNVSGVYVPNHPELIEGARAWVILDDSYGDGSTEVHPAPEATWDDVPQQFVDEWEGLQEEEDG